MSTLNFEVSFPHERQMNEFIKMLAWMELCGNVGHCTDFIVRLDGDGSARPKFELETDELQKEYDNLRKDILDNVYRNIPMYPDDIDIHVCIS